MSLEGMNWLAVIVSGIVYFALGALWYSPILFAKPFTRYRGEIKPEDQGNAQDYLLTLIADLVAAFVLALFVKAVNAGSLMDGIRVGLVAGAGFAAAASIVYTIFSGPHKMLWVIYSGYLLVAYSAMGAILALWR
jgi:RsiW-degrading membrane proteinase PrsW (M82 family)